MNYQYQSDFDKLGVDCPPKNYVPKTMTIYRWVFDTITDEDNFKPQYHKNPKRFNGKSDIEKCEAMALSMFRTATDAKNRFAFLHETMGEKSYTRCSS